MQPAAGAGSRPPRPLRPGSLLALQSGLWAVDVFQPAAAVLEPDSGAVGHIVSWSQLPPPQPGEPWPPPLRIGDGRSLWVQEDIAGPLARIGVDGVETAVWTGGLALRACGDDVAWCASPPPQQQLVPEPQGRPVFDLPHGWLLRVTADGRCSRSHAQEPVQSVTARPGGAWVELLVHPWTLRPLGGGVAEVVWNSRWLWLSAAEEPPEVLPSAARYGSVQGPGDRGGDRPVPRIDLAGGPVLPTDAVDIRAACWPLATRPAEAGSYEQQVLEVSGRVGWSWSGIRNLTASLVGGWPDTCLEWGFDSDVRPGLRLRRRVPLYDELGRIREPEHAAVHLVEDLDTGAVPPAGEAVDGVLDL